MTTITQPLASNEVINTPASTGLTKYLLVIFTIIFSECLVMVIALGLLSGYVHQTLEFSNLVGLVIGTQ